ncbi:MAG: type II toxin-antitoxin system ribonuclease VapC1 [Acidimicrobiales bacterium]
MALVIDASALVLALLGRSSDAERLRRRISDEATHAPHLIDTEVGNVLRRRTLRGELDARDAEALLVAAGPLVDHRYAATVGLARAAWARRDNVSYYDGLYSALAGALSVPLVTADARLGRAPGLGCRVELVVAER